MYENDIVTENIVATIELSEVACPTCGILCESVFALAGHMSVTHKKRNVA